MGRIRREYPTGKHLHLIAIVLLLISGLFSFSCNKPEDIKRYCLTVFVTDESSIPVQGAYVAVERIQKLKNVDGAAVERIQKRTDVEGKCTFPDLLGGIIVLRISTDDYLPSSQTLTLKGQTIQTVTLPLSKKPPFLSVDIEQIDTPEMTSSKTFHIQSNIDWSIVSTSDVLSFEPREGNGSKAVTVSWSFPEEQSNEDLALAEFTINSSLDTVTIPVRCHLPIRVVNVEAIAPNLVVNNQADAIGRVTFSRKVLPIDAWRDASTRYELRPVDDYTVEIVFPPLRFELGHNYPMRVRAESATGDGVSFDETVSVKFFDGYKKIEGIFNSWSLTKDETRIWVSTRSPYRIYELDSHSFSVLHSFDLNWEPGKLQLNQYNNRLYVIDNSHGSLKVLDPASGELLKTISRKPDWRDHPQSPDTIAYNILFADNGFGVLVMKSISSSTRWFFIDSQNDDTLEKNPFDKEFETWYDYWFQEMSLDHSRTKLIGAPTILNNFVHIIDSDTKTVTRYMVDNRFGSPELANTGGTILQQRNHKEKDLMLFSAPRSIVVYDYDNNKYTYPLIEDMLYTTSDFCYGDMFGNDICTYIFSWKGHWMEIYNHSSGALLYGSYTNIGSSITNQDLISFREGDRITVISTNGNSGTSFITFNTSRFSL